MVARVSKDRGRRKAEAMDQYISDSSLSDLRRQIEVLRERLERVESEQGRSAKGASRLTPRPAVTIFIVFAGFSLFMGVLGAENGQPDALFIGQTGNVGIGTRTPGFPLTFPSGTGDKISLWGQSGNHYGFGIQNGTLQIHTVDKDSRIAFGYGSSGSMTETMRIQGDGKVGIGTENPGAALDVAGTLKVSKTSQFSGGVGINTAPLADQNLVISPTKGNIPFNVTDPSKGTNWLSVMSDGKVLMNGGYIGIGTTDPKARLDVKGELRGKPWVSQEYAWKQNTRWYG